MSRNALSRRFVSESHLADEFLGVLRLGVFAFSDSDFVLSAMQRILCVTKQHQAPGHLSGVWMAVSQDQK